MNRIDQKLKENKKILSIYFTAGYPNLKDTTEIIKNLENSGVDMIEIGLPFSDPLADGPVIQNSSSIALANGMTTDFLLNQLENIRDFVKIPLLIMGYINPIVQFGVENFCKKCSQIGIDGLIIPDLPLNIYEKEYKEIFEKYGIYNILLITPQTTEKRIFEIDKISKGFIYMVSSNTTTGYKIDMLNSTEKYFERISKMNLVNPQIVGFGIHDKNSFEQATINQKGAIIGSEFVNFLKNNDLNNINEFISKY